MTKKEPSGKNNLNKAFKNVLLQKEMFGESKDEEKERIREEHLREYGNLEGWNPAWTEGIYSVGTMTTYIDRMSTFARYCAERGVKIRAKVTIEIAIEYLRERMEKGLSMYTLYTDASAINKAFGFFICLAKLGFPPRRKKDIKNNRTERDDAHLIKEVDQVVMITGTGIRRMSVLVIRPKDFVRNENGICIGVHVVEKGGRHRVAPLLNDYREAITEIVDRVVKDKGENAPIFTRYDRRIQYHRTRAKYAALLLHQLEEERANGLPLFGGAFAPSAYICLRGKDKKRGAKTRGFDTDLLAACSGALGHCRVSVVLDHYLYLY